MLHRRRLSRAVQLIAETGDGGAVRKWDWVREGVGAADPPAGLA
jgi:hypothetical protein